MERFMIHAVPERMWYVDGYLIPSMLEQGISRNAITVWNDEGHTGNLVSWLNSCRKCADDAARIPYYWHMQDDGIICRDFAQRTQELDKVPGVICGFASPYDRKGCDGLISPEAMWFSFQCIRIPNEYMKPFLGWFNNRKVWYDKQVNENKYDDMFFMKFMQDLHRNEYVLNCSPNLVDHMDYLIGGTTINPQRHNKWMRSIYWEDEDLVLDLAKRLGAEELYHEIMG